jgi:general secretion pathway protein G
MIQTRNQKAFTITELIFVIVVIGILSAIAVPKFAKTSILAHDAKAASVLSSVMSAIATERQKRILMGDFSDTGKITSLGSGNYAFSVFNKDMNDKQRAVVDLPISNCSSGETGCWTRNGTSYTYTFVDSGSADFKLENNKLVCDNDATDCNRLLK